ncbi:MAG TPA: hypothetical protein VN922_19370 [Bacteroidia bacterium]|nr:hypothetical protein [Bacteroidia bacterium]
MLNKQESFESVINALKLAALLSENKAVTNTKITLIGLDPQVVRQASHDFKTRLYPANVNNRSISCSYEPYEESSVKIMLISSPLDNLTIRAIEYTSSLS